jgi:WD40 repeat protein
VQSISISPDDQLLGILDVEGNLFLTNIDGNEEILKLDVGISSTAYPPDIDFSPDGRLLAASARNHVINIWDVSTGELATPPLIGHSADVGPVTFNPNSTILASGGGQGHLDSSVRLWDVSTGLPFGPPLTAHTSAVTSLEFSHDGSLLASGDYDGTMVIWDVVNGTPLLPPIDVGGTVGDLAFWPDGRTLSSFGANFEGQGAIAVRIWDLQVREPTIRKLKAHSFEVLNLAFSPDGNKLTSVDANGSILNWRLIDPDRITDEFSIPTILNFRKWPSIPRGDRFELSTDGDYLFVTTDSGSVESWTVGEDLELWHTYQGSSQPLRDLNFSLDGERVFGVGPNGSGVWLWDIDNRKDQEIISNLTESELLSAVISSDNQLLAAWTSNYDIKVWDLQTLQMLKAIPALSSCIIDSCRIPLAFNPNVSWLPNGDQLAFGEQRGVSLMTFVDDNSTTEVLPGGLTNIWTIAFSPDGRLLAAATADGLVALWDVQSGELIGQPRNEHEGEIWDMAFSPNGQVLATAGADQKIVIWDVDIFSVGEVKKDQTAEELIQRACSIVNRNFTDGEWSHFFGEEPYRQTCPEYPPPTSLSTP